MSRQCLQSSDFVLKYGFVEFRGIPPSGCLDDNFLPLETLGRIEIRLFSAGRQNACDKIEFSQGSNEILADAKTRSLLLLFHRARLARGRRNGPNFLPP